MQTETTKAKQHHLDLFYSGTINDKITIMEKVYDRHAEKLLRDPAVTYSLALLIKYAAELSMLMASMEMGALCSSCARQSGGGCCSSYMEANSDVMLLLMNRLRGAAVERQHNNGKECCFLGDSGCILPIKPIFCLNYNCSHIHGQATAADMKKLEQRSGRILTEQTRLETILLQAL